MNSSASHKFANTALQNYFGPQSKALIKEVDEEETSRELEEYCKDDSNFKRQPDSMSFQDRNSTGHWSTAKKPELGQGQPEMSNPGRDSAQSFYRYHGERKYSSKVDNYEPLHQYDHSREFRLQSFGGSETPESKLL